MKEMSLVNHLEELRKTMINIFLIIIFSFFVCYFFGEYLQNFFLKPLKEVLNNQSDGKVVFLGILDKVLTQLQLAFYSSIIISSPLWFYQLWRFIKPALHNHEIKVIRPFILVSFLLFCCGIVFGYYLVFPFLFETLLNFGVKNITATINLKDYILLSTKILILLGFIFQIPNLLLILGFMGIVTKQSLKKYRSEVYVVLAIASATITPPDVITMIGLWIPLALLFELGIMAVALIVHPYLAKIHK